MAKRSAMRQLLILGGTIFSVLTAWYAWWIRPQQVQLETLRAQVQQLMRQMQAATVQAQQIGKVGENIAQLQKELAGYENRLLHRRDVPQILRQLIRLGEKYHLRFAAVYPQYEDLLQDEASDGSPLLILPVQIKLSGEFFQFGRYIEQLDRQKFLFSVEQVDMVVTRESYPLIEVTVLGRLFLRQEKSDKKRVG